MLNSNLVIFCFRSLSRNVLSYFALPPAKPRAAFSRRDQSILLVAAIFFQTLYLLIIPLGFECDAAMYFRYAKTFIGAEGGGGAYYRAPGFPFFLMLSGQLLFGSFIPTVAAHAVMGGQVGIPRLHLAARTGGRTRVITGMLGLYIKGDSISKARAGFSVIDTTFDDGYGATLDLLVDASQMPSGGQQTFDQSTNSSFIKPVAWRPLQQS